ncbi:glycoside hydrolase family 2 protein [uncultured Polaribacter sp.]|uniref:beta-mannosidase n=1 Tax=uncultured Polaribacter sp. TaxID=174711 RepID=UPI0026284FE5|nr:glycoside hydrolase family 2 protein [uncultured Polaribacter sp.]
MNSVLLLLMIIPYFVGCQTKRSNHMIRKEINSNWVFKDLDKKYSGVAKVPGTIHTDLLANNFIKDPFYRTNEKQQQWIDKKDWEYTTILNVSAEEFKKNNIRLNFEGLDTYADVFLNDSLILNANNMFRSWEIDVKSILKKGENQLKILLHSPIKKGLELLEVSPYPYPAINDQSENGEIGDKKVSIFTRKAGYHYGWDWGPRLVTSGIWRPVVLKSWNTVRINDVFIKQPSITKEEAQLIFDVTLEVDAPFSGKINIINKNSKIIYAFKNLDFKSGLQNLAISFSIENPKLWWSQGLGEPNMYNFTVQLLDDEGNETSKKEISTGLRSIKLIREKDAMGESFLFELNGVPVFIKGANYIPNDSFLPRVTKSDYEKVIADAGDANMNMLRVWGGGIYEDDYFYKLCDENGLMVWQDFMFACSMYPGDASFLENIKQEAIENVVRLRNHPSIALWCGNNEINTAWSHYSKGGWGWKEKYTKPQREEIQKAYLDIFHEILPKVVKNYTDGDYYWPSSPQAGFEPQKHAGYENTSGDMHYWGVWHGQHTFENFEKYKARFMSEYGFQSFPDFETVKKYTLPEDHNIESAVMASHQRSGIGNLRIKEYMSWDYKVPDNFENFLYMSQVLQARGVKMAIEAHRRAMPYTMGTMYWQINDCWPVASWSSTDYYHKWKALHYAVKKVYEPIILTVHEEKKEMVIHAVSDRLNDGAGKLKLTILDFNGKELFTKEMDVVAKKNTSSELFRTQTSKFIKGFNQKKIVLKTEFIKLGDSLTIQNLFYFKKPKFLALQKPNIKTELIEENDTYYLKISTDKLVKDLYLNFKNKKVFLEGNYFDLLPNEIKSIEITTDEVLDIKNLELQHIHKINNK